MTQADLNVRRRLLIEKYASGPKQPDGGAVPRKLRKEVSRAARYKAFYFLGRNCDNCGVSQQTTVRLKGRAMEVFLRDLGKQVPYSLFQCYSTQRRIFMLGPEGADKADFDWKPGTMVPAGTRIEDHAKSFFFLIQPGTLLALDRAKREQVMLALRRTGDISRKTLYDELELGLDSEKEEKQIMKEAMEKAKILQMMKGGGPGGGPGGGAPNQPITAGPGAAAPQQVAA
jgi:hypothetical protein